MPRPAVFLDRDGTLNVTVPRDGRPGPPHRLEDFQLAPGVTEGCRALHAAGFVLVVATNQPDVGRGQLAAATVAALHARLVELVPEIARIESCFAPADGVGPDAARRKPAPGMLLDAAAELDLDLTRSWLIGDRAKDIACGHAAGVRTILIDHGLGEADRTAPHALARTFAEAVAVVLRHARPPR